MMYDDQIKINYLYYVKSPYLCHIVAHIVSIIFCCILGRNIFRNSSIRTVEVNIIRRVLKLMSYLGK